MKILINTLFAGIKAKNKDGYLYQNNRPYMEKVVLMDTICGGGQVAVTEL